MANKVGLWINKTKDETGVFTKELLSWFNQAEWDTEVDWDKTKTPDVDFVLSLGGDGTVLEAAREAAGFGVPVLGVNYGRLGFLCEVERNEIFAALSKVTRNEYTIEERLMLIASLNVSGKKQNFTVLNDVVFLRGGMDSMITLQVELSGERIASPPSDGLIIATPTGSTAYSLSAGGPVVGPEVESILITPLAAHSLSSRPMVVSFNEKIEVTLVKGHDCSVHLDGDFQKNLALGERVSIVTSPLKAKLIRLSGRNFPKVLREKLRDRWHD